MIVKGKHKKVIGMVSNWDVLTKIAVRLVQEGPMEEPEQGELEEPEEAKEQVDNGEER